MDISFIIVNYNTQDHLQKCLYTLFAALSHGNHKFEVIIVDNNSPDRSFLDLKKEFREIKFVLNKENVGFGAACNIGIQNSIGKYICFINPDTYYERDVFTELIKFYEKIPMAGFLGCLLIDDENNLIYSFNDFPSYYWELLQALGMGSNFEIGKLLKKKEIINKTPFEVDWLIGAFMFTTKEIVDKLKGFDERIFLYYEDIDIQYRAKLLGYKNYCLPNLQVNHFTKSSVRSEQGDDVYHFYMYKSKMMYYYLHYSFFKRNFLRIFLITGLLLRILTLFFRRKFPAKKRKMKQYMYMLRYFAGSRNTAFENKKI